MRRVVFSVHSSSSLGHLNGICLAKEAYVCTYHLELRQATASHTLQPPDTTSITVFFFHKWPIRAAHHLFHEELPRVSHIAVPASLFGEEAWFLFRKALHLTSALEISTDGGCHLNSSGFLRRPWNVASHGSAAAISSFQVTVSSDPKPTKSGKGILQQKILARETPLGDPAGHTTYKHDRRRRSPPTQLPTPPMHIAQRAAITRGLHDLRYDYPGKQQIFIPVR